MLHDLLQSKRGQLSLQQTTIKPNMLFSSQDITQYGALDLSRAIHTKHVSCREVMLATLAQVDRLNPQSNAVVSRVAPDVLLQQAQERDAQLARGESIGWMHGIPQAIKDLANVAGLRTTLGSPLMKDFVASEDGLMARRMKAAGAIVIGKTNTPEFGLGSHTFNEVFGPTRNAWNPGKSAGGSSGGAAVALAQRLLPVADGSDFMGSLRNPAGWNHVFGMRPSQGRVPMSPAQDVFIAQLGTEGPMGRHVRDVAMLLSVQAGADPASPLSLTGDPAVFAGSLDSDPKGQRVGWLGDLQGYLPMENGILEICQIGLEQLFGHGLHRRRSAFGHATRANLASLAGVAAGLGGAAHRAFPGQPGQPRPHQARGAVGVRPVAELDWLAIDGRQRQPHALLPKHVGFV
jgi:amidase